MMKTMKIKFGTWFNPNSSYELVHIISNDWKWKFICGVVFGHDVSIYKIEWKNICPRCKRLYGKNLKQDIIIQKLKGEK